jgi:hypothetical protein
VGEIGKHKIAFRSSSSGVPNHRYVREISQCGTRYSSLVQYVIFFQLLTGKIVIFLCPEVREFQKVGNL